MTRIIDILFSFLVIIIFLPFLPILAFLIKLDSKGPVFYASKRVGRGGKIFRMYKLRTMYETPVPLGPSVSPQGDPRVTPMGRVLRRLKLNEFPQFYNVLKGDMTLVGPRPEAPDLAQIYPEAYRRIFSVKPGLAGPNQILGRNEEESYAPGIDPTKYYLEEILPKKMAIDFAYIDNKSFFKDLRCIFMAVKVTVTGALSRRHLLDNRSQLLMLGADTLLCLISFSLAHGVRFEGGSTPAMSAIFWKVLPWTVAFRLPIFLYFGLYNTMIRHLSLYDIKRVIYAVGCGSILLVSCSFLSGKIFGYSRGVFLIDWFSLTTFLISYRLILKKVQQWYTSRRINPVEKQKVFIWGAGDAGELCLLYLKNGQTGAYEVAGFIDDDPKKQGKQIGGVKILGDRHHLPILVQLYAVELVFVAIPSATSSEVQEIIRIGTDLNLKMELFLPAEHPSPDTTMAGGTAWDAVKLGTHRSPFTA